MINKIKLYIVLGVIGLISGIVVYYWNAYSLVKTKNIKQKSDSILILSKKVILQDSLLWSIQQDLDICNNNKSNHQSVIAQLTKERNEARDEAKVIREAIEHYEANDLMRFFVYDPKGWFQKGCFKEVEKPDNICK